MHYLQLSYLTALFSNNEVYVIENLWMEADECIIRHLGTGDSVNVTCDVKLLYLTM